MDPMLPMPMPGLPPPPDPSLGAPPMYPGDPGAMGGVVAGPLPQAGGPGAMALPPAAPPPAPLPLPLQLGPRLPGWYKKPKKPTLAQVLAEAEREKGDHEVRLRVAQEVVERINLERKSYFERDAEAVESGEVETPPLTDLRDEHDAVCAWIAGMDLSWEAKGRHAFDREEVAAVEDYLHFFFERWAEDHEADGNGPLAWALPDVLQKHGMLAAYVCPDREREDTGVDVRMVNPASVFPVFEGGRGLTAVYLVQEAEAGNVVGDYGYLDEGVERKVRKSAKTDEGRYDPHRRAELVAYWDRHWCLVAWGGELLAVEEHGLGAPPFVVRYACFGQQGFAASPETTVRAIERLWRNDAYLGANTRAVDLARMAQPFLLRRVEAHDAEEAIFGRQVTFFRKLMNWPLVAKQGILSQGEGPPEVDSAEGGVTRVRDDDALEPLPLPAEMTAIVTPMMAQFAQNRATGVAPGLLMGQNPAAQTSGSAMQVLATGGFEKWSPVVLCVEAFLSAVGKLALEYLRDWGEVLGPDADGVLYVPRRNPAITPGNISPDHELTPEQIRRVGVRVKATLTKFNIASLAQSANGAIMLKSMGIADKRTLMRLLGFTNDVEGVLRRVDEDLLNDVPEVKQTKTLKTLVKLSEKAIAAGDEDSGEEYMADAMYVAEQMQMQYAQKMAMTMAMMGNSANTGKRAQEESVAANDANPAGVPVEPPMPGDPAGMLQTGGLPMTDMGVGVGTQGGRPPGGMPPGAM